MPSAPVHDLTAKMLKQTDEAGLSKLLIEVVLLEVADQSPNGESDILTTTAKRHRVDVEKVRKAVEQELTVKRAKVESKQKTANHRYSTRVACGASIPVQIEISRGADPAICLSRPAPEATMPIVENWYFNQSKHAVASLIAAKATFALKPLCGSVFDVCSSAARPRLSHPNGRQ